MTTFLDHFKIDQTQSIDFLNLNLEKDTKIFLDPYIRATKSGGYKADLKKMINIKVVKREWEYS